MNKNEKIAKWLGFKIFYDETWDTDQEFPMFIPSGKPKRTHMIDAIRFPDFQNDFNACLKWIIPKLRRWDVEFGSTPNNKYYVILIDDKAEFPQTSEHESLPVAFCNALIKVIDSEEKK